MFDNVEAGAEVEAAEVGHVAEGALPGLDSLRRGPGAGAESGRPLTSPQAPVQGSWNVYLDLFFILLYSLSKVMLAKGHYTERSVLK